jgi:hypothetical protein
LAGGVMIMRNMKTKTIFLFACATVFAVCAEASLYNDSAAMTGFKNKTSFNITMSGSVLNVDVEYAVYSPGDYPGDDRTDDSEYIYAYQILNSTQSNVAVDFFSVGILSGSSIDFIYIDTGYGTPGGIRPIEFPHSAGYVFIRDALNPGQWSDVLIFSSTYSPTIGFGTVSGGGLSGMGSGMGSLATPSVPEPATILFIAPAIFILRIKKRTKVK